MPASSAQLELRWELLSRVSESAVSSVWRQPGSGSSIRGVIWLVHSSDYLWEIVSFTYSNCFKTCELLKKYVFTPSPKFVVCGSLATFCGSRLYSLRSIHWYPSHLQHANGSQITRGRPPCGGPWPRLTPRTIIEFVIILYLQLLYTSMIISQELLTIRITAVAITLFTVAYRYEKELEIV